MAPVAIRFDVVRAPPRIPWFTHAVLAGGARSNSCHAAGHVGGGWLVRAALYYAVNLSDVRRRVPYVNVQPPASHTIAWFSMCVANGQWSSG